MRLSSIGLPPIGLDSLSNSRIKFGAGDETRTRDVLLGKEVLYH